MMILTINFGFLLEIKIIKNLIIIKILNIN